MQSAVCTHACLWVGRKAYDVIATSMTAGHDACPEACCCDAGKAVHDLVQVLLGMWVRSVCPVFNLCAS